jgi:hypothetical protein
MWDGFLLKLDPNGAEVWTTVFSSSLADDVNDVTVTSEGIAYATGDTQGMLGAASFDGTDIFVARLFADGEVDWIEQAGAQATESGNGIALAPGNLVFISGQTTGPLTGEAIFVNSSGFVGRFSTEN